MNQNLQKDKRGITMVWVLIFLLITTVIALSIAGAAYMANTTQLQYRDNRACFYYANNLAQCFTAQIEGAIDTSEDTAWNKIAQSVYDAEFSGATPADATVSAAGLTMEEANGEFWTEQDGASEIKISLSEQQVTVMQAYSAAEDAVGQPGDWDYIPAKSETPESTSVRFQMQLQIKATKNKQSYTTTARYRFDGMAVGVPTGAGGDGVLLQSGNWELLGYTKWQ